MKKILIFSLLALMPLVMSAQGQINTKKMKIADVTAKTVKVVLTGDVFFDEAMKEEMMLRWHISPYEFCTLEEFGSLKKDPSFYFLLNMKGQFRKEEEPGIRFLCMVKGDTGAGEGVDGMLDVVTVPFCPADNPNGREIVFLPAFLDIIQDYVISSMESDKDGYGGLPAFASGLSKTGAMDLVISHEDMSEEISDVNFHEYNITPMNDDESYDCMLNNQPGTIVTYCVSASDPVPGSVCYKMIIDCSSHKLYWFKKMKITKNSGTGFLLKDINRIRAERTY